MAGDFFRVSGVPVEHALRVSRGQGAMRRALTLHVNRRLSMTPKKGQREFAPWRIQRSGASKVDGDAHSGKRSKGTGCE